jgi:aerobic C4-dicarboxylate transport protein
MADLTRHTLRSPSPPRGAERAGVRWGSWKRLYLQVLAAVAIGAALGHLAPDLAVSLKPLGDAFIKAIRMLIAPIIFCTVVHGIARMADMARVGRVALKAIVYFEIMTTIALIIGLIAVNLLRPGAGMNIDPASINTAAIEPYVKQTAAVGFVSFLMNIIPSTFVGAFAEGNILQVLFIAVVCGFALVQLGERAKPLVDIIDIAAKMIFAVVGIVMWAAPIGAFGAIAFTVGKFGVGSLASLGKLLACFYLTCVVFIIVALGPVARLCGFSLLKLIRYIWGELLICIATTSSETVLPRMITKLENLGCEETVVGLVIPTGYSFNLDAFSIYLTLAVVFLAQATNTPLSIGDLLLVLAVSLVTSKGAHGVPGSAIVILAATLNAVPSIPAIGLVLVLSVDWFIGMVRALGNLIGNCVATVVVAAWEKELDLPLAEHVLDSDVMVEAEAA